VILTDVPIGRGNERNLEAVRAALSRGARVLALEGVLANDFSGKVEALRDTAVEFVGDVADLLDRLG